MEKDPEFPHCQQLQFQTASPPAHGKSESLAASPIESEIRLSLNLPTHLIDYILINYTSKSSHWMQKCQHMQPRWFSWGSCHTGAAKTPNNSSVHLKLPLPSWNDLCSPSLCSGLARCSLSLPLAVYLGKNQMFHGKEPSCNHISYRLGNAGAMFNGRCQKEVPCWWPSLLMYHWDHSNWEVPWDNTALWPKWLLVEFHKWSHCHLSGVAQRIEKGLCNCPFISLIPTLCS